MRKINLAMALMGLFTPQYSAPAIAADAVEAGMPKGKIKQGKGQLRDAKPKASGVAQSKRAATKRNNIRKNK